MDKLYVLCRILVDVFFSGILSIQCKIRRDQPADTRRSTGRSRSICWPPLTYAIVGLFQETMAYKPALNAYRYLRYILLCL